MIITYNDFFEYTKSCEKNIKSNYDKCSLYKSLHQYVSVIESDEFLDTIGSELGIPKFLCIKTLAENIDTCILFGKVFKKYEDTNNEILMLIHAILALENVDLEWNT